MSNVENNSTGDYWNSWESPSKEEFKKFLNENEHVNQIKSFINEKWVAASNYYDQNWSEFFNTHVFTRLNETQAFVLDKVELVKNSQLFKDVSQNQYVQEASPYFPHVGGFFGGTLVADGVIKALKPRTSKLKAGTEIAAGIALTAYSLSHANSNSDPYFFIATLGGVATKAIHSAVKHRTIRNVDDFVLKSWSKS